MPRTIQCIYLKKEAEGLDYAPYPGDLGKRIYNEVSKEAWQAWMKHQTMLVNENRLNLADQRARPYRARPMGNVFLRTGAEQVAGYGPPAARGGRGIRGQAPDRRRMRSPALRIPEPGAFLCSESFSFVCILALSVPHGVKPCEPLEP